MKCLYYLLGFIILFLYLPVTTFSQMQDVSWKTLPSPSVGTETITGNLSKLEITDDGNIYFLFYDESSSTLRIKHLDIETNTWVQIFGEVITGITPSQLETYRINNEVYFVLTRENFPYSMDAWVLDPNQNVTNLFMNQTTSMETNFGFDFVVDKNTNQLYFATRDLNSELIVDVFDLTNFSYVAPFSVGYMSFGVPQLAIDHTNNQLYVMSINGVGEYRVHSAQLGVTPGFTPVNTSGELTSNQFVGNAAGNLFTLNEKSSEAPSIILNHGLSTPSTYRLGIPGSPYVDASVEAAPGLESFATAGTGQSDYVLAQFPSQNLLFVKEVFPDGTSNKVANNNNPTLATMISAGSAYALSKAPNHERLAAFYHAPGNNGTSGGNFKLTNNAPSLVNVTPLNGCVNQFGPIAKNIVFSDLDADKIFLTNNFTSSNPSVIDVASIQTFNNALGHWAILANPIGQGTTDITFNYTDGLDTLSTTITITVTAPINASFDTATIELCSNKNLVDFNDYVTEPGGSFSIAGYTSENGSFNLDSLNISAYPMNGSISYEFEDLNGCTSTDNASFIVYDAPTAVLSVTNSTCGNSNGEIVANVDSPNGTFDSYWNTGDQNTLTASNLTPGTYYLNIIDQVGCIHVAQENIVASDFAVVGNVTNPSCFNGDNGSIQLDVFGGSGNYDVLWSTGHSTQNLNGLSAGNYQVIVTDTDGCEATRSFLLENPNKFIVNYNVTKPDCGQSNGAITLTGSNGGVNPYTFNWTTGQGQQTTQDLTGINTGQYAVTVTDNLGCEAQRNFQVNSINAPIATVDRVRKSMCGMSNGKIDITVTPTTGELITGIQWSNGETTEDIANLAPDTYECVISQSNGCEAVYEYNVGTARPFKPQICIVTVDTSTNTNLVVWEKPTNNPFNIEYYNIYRETSVAHQFQKIDTVHHSNISVFNDVVASPANRSWRYRISAVNSCGIESAPSRIHKTMHLVMNENNGEVNVIWDNYEGFLYNSYDLLRRTENQNWTVIVPNITQTTLPFYSETPPTVNGLNYMIEVFPPNGTCTATEGKAQDYNAARSNKPTSIFNPGEGTGDPNNSLAKEENEDFTVALYPNPSNGIFEVAMYHVVQNASLNMQVVDVNGKVIHENEIINGVNYINLQNIDSGVYFVKLYDQSNSETIRIIVN